MQGAILRVKLRYLEGWTESRRAHAAEYSRLLSGSSVITPAEMPYARHVFHVYAIRTTARESLQQSLTKADIQSGIHYPIPVHLLPAYSDLGYKPGDFPITEKIANEELSLPMFAELTNEQIDVVVKGIQS